MRTRRTGPVRGWAGLLVFLVLGGGSVFGAMTHPLNYGAKLDGVTNDQPALQAAIDAAHAAGGGTVVVPAGRTLLSGSIQLKSRVALHLEPGSRLVASTERADYRDRALIQAADAEEIAITGSGTIDGRGVAFMREELPHIFRPAAWRPRLIILEGCRRVQVRDITLRDSPSWTLHLAGCEDVTIHGISIFNNLKIPNCDGINPDHSRNVRISDCHIEAGDDCIVLKSTRAYEKYGPCESIVVTNCTLVSSSAALKIGTETVGVIRDVVFSNCVIRNSHRGVAIVLRDEGSIENVLVENLVIETRLLHPDWWGAAEPIYVSARPRQPGGRLGTVRGLRFRQILARGEGGVFIEGTPGHEVEDMLLDGVSVDWKQSSGQTSGRIDVRPPESVGTTIEPVAGFRIRSARDVRVRDAAVRWISPRPAGATAVDASGVGVKFDDVRESQAPPEVERSAFVRPVGAPMR
jgi:hypothetical protein